MEGFCRGCLIRYDEPAELIPHTEEIKRLFIYSTGIKVKQNEIETFQLCKGCHVNMKLSCKFKKQCRTSDKKFKHYLTLKEVGDTFDLTTYLKSNDESLRFPLISGYNTPANRGAASERERDDDNGSTCTSIRNFMTDILQGEEVPDNEANIIREVIEETDLLEDTLDSHLLQDDISRDTDFRDLSFSPFSTPRSNHIDHCYTPVKQIETDINNYNNISDQNVQLPCFKDKIEEPNQEITKSQLLQTIDAEMEKSDENVSIFNEVIDHNINYVTQNENDIAVPYTEHTIHNETYYAAKALQKENEKYSAEINYLHTQDKLAVKYLLEMNNDNDASEKCDENSCYASQSDNGVKDIEILMDQSGTNEISISQQHDEEKGKDFNDVNDTEDLKEVNITEDIQNHVLNTYTDNSLSNKKLNHEEILLDNKIKITIKINNDEKCDINIQNNNDIEEDLKTGSDNDLITLEDLLVAPTACSKAPGASTPMINNILFGEKLDLNDDSNQDKQKFGTEEIDILDEMLNEGVKEFSIHTVDSQAADVYDIDQCYCKTCHKKLNTLRGFKIHLSRLHGIKLPPTRLRVFDIKSRICKVCGYVSKYFKAFQRHMKSHSDVKYECSICQIAYLTEKRLKQHMKTHDKAQEKEANDLQLGKLVCATCGKRFKHSGNLATHMKRHSKNYTMACEECGRGFYRKIDLVKHSRVHTQEKPFECKYCDKKFPEKYTLVKHVKIHLGDKPYKCDKCLAKFVLHSGLKFHSKNCKGVKVRKPIVFKFQCAYCRNKFTSKRDFVKHQKNYDTCATFHGTKHVLVLDGTKQDTDIDMSEEI